jgi:hypothetical protein
MLAIERDYFARRGDARPCQRAPTREHVHLPGELPRFEHREDQIASL